MPSAEQIDRATRRHFPSMKKWLKRQANKVRRTLWKLKGEDAPPRVTKGWGG